MDSDSNLRDQRLNALEFPLRNAGKILRTNSERKQTECLDSGICCIRECWEQCGKSDIASLKIGQEKMSAIRVAPCFIRGDREGYGKLTMMVAGEQVTSKVGTHLGKMKPGDVFLGAGTGGRVSRDYFSGIIWDIENNRLARTMRSMRIAPIQYNPMESYALHAGGTKIASATNSAFFAYIKFIDSLLGESIHLPESLGLDEQFYRLLALSLSNAEGSHGKVQNRWECKTNNWTNPLDDLVDYIRQSAHLHLTLTDLEIQSHYTGRHLQTLFKEKFDCTPMQFVRRERLSAAMEKLQTGDFEDTVTNIARDIGYLHTSNFTADFQREFGVKPSVVLRSSRRARNSA